MKKFQQGVSYFLIIAVSVGVWGVFAGSSLMDGLEDEALRWRYLARGELQSTAPIIYVDLDAETVSYMGDRPWDRREFAVLCAALLGPGQARVVGIDIILSKFGAGALLDVERARRGDAFLGSVVEAFPEQIVLAAAYTGIQSSFLEEFGYLPLIRQGLGDPETAPFPEAPSFPIIKENVGRLALVNVDEGLTAGTVPYYVPAFVRVVGPRFSLHLIDGAKRHFEAVLNQPDVIIDGDRVKLIDADGWSPISMTMHHEQTFYSLGLEMFLAAHGLSESAVTIESGYLNIEREGVAFRRIPLVSEQSMEVNWFEAWPASSSETRISMQAVLRQVHALAEAERLGDSASVEELEAWFTRFKDKVIFLGPVDPLLEDIAPTPFNREPVPKVGLHANIYRTIESEAYVRRAGMAETMVILSLLTLFVSLFVLRSGWTRGISVVALFAYIAVTFFVFSKFHYVLPLLAPVGAATMAAVFCGLLKLGSEEWQRRRIKTLFGAYVSPELVEQMVEAQQNPQLGGVESEITALFSDVVDFSALSEELSPERLVALMNEYLGAMTEVFQAQSGTLDKYIGDAIVTMFGMPVWTEDHAARACLSALKMQERHTQLRKQWAASGKWPKSVSRMRTRIGINTGLAVIGNMGSEMRFNYTMMGDSVNLAARCESGAKQYGVYTMITEDTLRAALATGLELRYRMLDRVIVKGRNQAVVIYELWEDSICSESSSRCKQAYEAALELYFKGEWGAALSGFEDAAEHEPGKAYAPTTPSEVLASRCREYLETGGPTSWKGAFQLESK
ncbi:MAG: adenylate/guanylate cyclase domain-containing protein [Puniceicoccaceae bacterium]|nr:MAG: adenylate/guanylate cyclase domain-containing protein [Puniceicoccaceae bacterium]